MDKPEVLMITVKQIREKYPYPQGLVYGKEIGPDEYCVLGAFIRYIRHSPDSALVSFPSAHHVVPKLMRLNSNLSYSEAQAHCLKIISLNDRGNDFEAAWAELDKALTEGQTGGANGHSQTDSGEISEATFHT
jgi:hypothetical protein